jgi:hypothetical protein
LENAATTVGIEKSGGSSIATASICLSLFAFFFVVKLEDFFLSHPTTLKILVYDVYAESLLIEDVQI